MPSPNINYGDIASSTIANYQPTAADNLTENNALLKFMKANGAIEITGGDPILETITYTANSNTGSYSGYDTLPTAATDTFTASQFTLAQYATPIAISGREQLQNNGKQRIIDLIKGKVKVAESSLNNRINVDLYLDGTGNGGKNLTGLAAALPLAPTNVYGAIDRNVSSNAFWKNQKWQASVDGSGVATAATIQTQWNSFVLSMTRGTDKPNVIIAAPNVYSIFMASLQVNQRFTDASMASAGFGTIKFNEIPVFFDSLAAGISTSVAYFINTDYLHFRPHADRQFTTLDDKSSVNQDATVKTLVWAGNLTCSGSRFNGVFSNT